MYNQKFIDENLEWLIEHPIKEQRFLSGEIVLFVKLPNRSIKTFSKEEFEYFELKKKQQTHSIKI